MNISPTLLCWTLMFKLWVISSVVSLILETIVWLDSGVEWIIQSPLSSALKSITLSCEVYKACVVLRFSSVLVTKEGSWIENLKLLSADTTHLQIFPSSNHTERALGLYHYRSSRSTHCRRYVRCPVTKILVSSRFSSFSVFLPWMDMTICTVWSSMVCFAGSRCGFCTRKDCKFHFPS